MTENERLLVQALKDLISVCDDITSGNSIRFGKHQFIEAIRAAEQTIKKTETQNAEHD